MTGEPGWASFLEEHFPGYLLPSSARHALSEEAAARFLERITGRPEQLTLLRAVSTLSPRIAMLRDFALRELPELVRRLPARTETVRRDWEGGFQGRLDVRATLPFHLVGQRTHFVTRARTRRFDMPENVLVRAVAVRLLGLLERLRRASAIASVGWGAELSACEASLRHTLSATVLREVPDAVVTPFHEQAAAMGRSPCYALALAWYRALRDGMDSRDEQTIAQVVAQGALAPLDMPTRFELAVVVRLVHALWSRLDGSEPGRWTFHRTLVAAGRREIADLERDDGTHVRVFYNQAWLPAGPSDLGASHYFEHTGRLRPDVTVVTTSPEGAEHAVVIEVKLSSDRAYLLQGLHEAHLYRAEYAPLLTGWPKAILVASGDVPGEPRRQDDVLAVPWHRWVPDDVVSGILAPVVAL